MDYWRKMMNRMLMTWWNSFKTNKYVLALFGANHSAFPYHLLLLAVACCCYGCTPKEDPEELDKEAPKINLKQTSIWLETGDQLAPNTLVISVSDNTDTNPIISASLNGQTISYTDAYAFANAGDFTLKIKAADKFWNTNSSDIAVNVGVGVPSLIWLETLQTTVNPKVNIPMDLLSGVKASDTRDGDITAKIKVYLKNTDATYTEITTPKSYTIKSLWTITLKYEVTDNNKNIASSNISLNILSWNPIITGLDSIQATVQSKTGIPMDLLSGIKAIDGKEVDITSSIKIYLKNTDGTYTEIVTPKSYIVKNIGKIALKYQVTDSYENNTISEVSLNVASGMPVFTGLENLQTTINPKTEIPMNLLSGVKAIDGKEVDITASTKVYTKNQAGQFVLISNPTAYVVSVPGALDLKYQITDSYNQTTEVEKSLNVIQEALTVPQMQIMPTDPAFNPNHPSWYGNSVKNRIDYLNTLKVPEVRAMGESMVRSGTNDMSKSEYLSRLNKWQLALNNAAWIPIGTDTEWQYVIPNTAFPPTYHEDGCNQLLLGKKNNGVASTGLVWPLIQQWGVNKAIWMEDGWMDLSNGYNVVQPIKNRLQNNPDKYLVISSSASLWWSKEEIKNILNTGRVVWFQSAGNIMDWQGQHLSISITEQSATGDPREFSNNLGAYDLGNVTIPVQRVGWCRENFTVNVDDPVRGKLWTAYLTGDQKNIRYAPGVHAYIYNQQNMLIANKEAFTSQAAPTQTGLYYLLVAAFPELTPVEILDKMRNEYAYPVKVTFAQEPTRGYTSKTTDIGKAYKSLSSKPPTQISLSSTSSIQIPKGRYKFNIIHGDGVVLSNGSKITQTDLNDIGKRGQLTQENYVIDPTILKKMGKKAGDKITIHVSVCSDDQEQYKQIRDIPYEIAVIN